MRRKLIGILLVLCSLNLIGCSSIQRGFSNLFFPPNRNSDIREKEKVDLKLFYEKTRTDVAMNKLAPPDSSTIDAFLPVAIAPLVAEQAVKQVESFLKKEAERYSATYSAVAVGDIFYQGWKSDSPINLRGIQLTRKAGNDQNTAMDMCFLVQPTLDERAFQIKPIALQLDMSKAKLVAFDWFAPFGWDLLAPWTMFQKGWKVPIWDGDNDVDLLVKTSIHGVWVDEKQKGHTDLLASHEIKLKNIELQKEKQFMKIKAGNDEIKCNNLDKITSAVLNDTGNLAAMNSVGLGQLFNAIPRNKFLGDDGKKIVGWGPGNFIVSILVTEYDNYGERVKEIGEIVKEQRKGLVDRITEGLQ